MEYIKSILDNFFKHDEKKVLVIKGKWGVGKTFYWKKYVEFKKNFNEKIISYVSLFGLEDIKDIKKDIFDNAEFINKKNYKDTLKSLTKSTYSLVRLAPKIKDFRNIGEKFENLIIKNFIICFDDVERKSDKLSLAQIFGLISILKEENNCRFILIFNEDLLSKNDKSDLTKYREKIIDIEVLYDPSIKYNVDLIFNKSDYYDLILDTFNELEINNIRVIKQTKWNLDYFSQFLSQLEESLAMNIFQDVIYISCFHYDNKFNFSIKELEDIYQKDFLSLMDRTKTNENLNLASTNYRYSEFDEFIISYIVDGALNENEFKQNLDKINEIEKKDKILKQYSQIWKIYNSNFLGKEEDFISHAIIFLDKYAHLLSYRQLDEICSFIRKIDEKINTNKWLDIFIENNLNNFSYEDLKLYIEKTSSSKIKELVTHKMQEFRSKKSIKEIVYYIVEHQGWNNIDLILLDSYSEDDYFKWISEESDANLLGYIRAFLKIFNSTSSDELHKSIGSKLENALKKKSKESIFNHLRVKYFFKL